MIASATIVGGRGARHGKASSGRIGAGGPSPISLVVRRQFRCATRIGCLLGQGGEHIPLVMKGLAKAEVDRLGAHELTEHACVAPANSDLTASRETRACRFHARNAALVIVAAGACGLPHSRTV